MYKLLAFAVVSVLMIRPAQSQRQVAVDPAAQRPKPPSKSAADVQKYVDELKASLQKRTSFAAAEPNDEKLWANVRQTVENDLRADWTAGILVGNKPQEAFFVKCDRTTMTQNDLDNGRLIVQVGVAPVRPAEFVIFRITQKTADAKQPEKRNRKP